MIGNVSPQDNYRIDIDGEWTLRDLYDFPHVYAQLYSFLYVLEFTPEDFDDERIDSAFRSHPWRGGFSAVNFYNQLGYIVQPATDQGFTPFVTHHRDGLS